MWQSGGVEDVVGWPGSARSAIRWTLRIVPLDDPCSTLKSQSQQPLTRHYIITGRHLSHENQNVYRGWQFALLRPPYLYYQKRNKIGQPIQPVSADPARLHVFLDALHRLSAMLEVPPPTNKTPLQTSTLPAPKHLAKSQHEPPLFISQCLLPISHPIPLQIRHPQRIRLAQLQRVDRRSHQVHHRLVRRQVARLRQAAHARRALNH